MGNPFSSGGHVTLKGHTTISSVRFVAGGALVTAGDKSVRVWHRETLKPEKVWKFNNVVETCCCSPDGRYIACGLVDGLVFVFDLRTKKQVAHWQAHADCGQGPLLQFFADSTYLLSAAIATCKLWSSRTTKLINVWETALITSLHASADCTLLAVGSNTGMLIIHSLPDGNAIRRLRAHRGEVWALAFSPDRSLLASASKAEPDGVRLWATDGWSLLQTLRGHSGFVLDCSFASDGLHLATCGTDRTIRVWHASRQRSGQALVNGQSPAYFSAGLPGDDRIFEASAVAGRVASTASWRCVQILDAHSDAVVSCDFAPPSSVGGSNVLGNTVVASGSRDGLARAWKLIDVGQGSASSPLDMSAEGLDISLY